MYKRKKQIYSIFLLIFFDEITIAVSVPVLTFLCFDSGSHLFSPNTAFSVRSYWFGLFNALPHVIAMITAPLLCILSDHVGRKKLLLWGAAGALIFSCCSIVSILFSSLVFITLGYIFNGLCVRTEPIALAALADCSAPEDKVVNMGYLQFWISAGAFLGPLLGGYFAKRYFFSQINFSLPYFIGIIFGVFALGSTIFLFNENRESQRWRSQSYFSFRLLGSKPILILSLLLVLSQLSWRTYYVFIPSVLKISFHYSPMQIGIFMALIALWLALASGFLIKILLQYFSYERILYYAFVSVFIGLLLTNVTFFIPPCAANPWIIKFSAIPIAMGDVVIYSILSALFSNVTAAHQQGLVMGLNFTMVAFVWGAVSLIGGWLGAFNCHLPLIIAPIGVLIALFLPRWNISVIA